MSQSSSVESSCDEVGNGFSPERLHVLLVDDDPRCQQQIQDVLKICSYEVTICSNRKDALSLLRTKRSQFDIALVDVDMPDMEGLKLLECVVLEMDLPVVMISGNYTKETIIRGEALGACDFYHKPLGIDAAKRLWHSIIHRKFHKLEQEGIVEGRKQSEESCNIDHGENVGQTMPGATIPMSDHSLQGFYNPTMQFMERQHLQDARSLIELKLMPGIPKAMEPAPNMKRKRDLEVAEEGNEYTSGRKKPRVVWTPALHRKFTLAVEHVGLDKATPKIISELMNEPNLTRASISSHLQKYREYIQQMSVSKKSQAGSEKPISKKVHPSHLKELRKQILAQYVEAIRSVNMSPTVSGPPLLVADPNSQDNPTIQFVEVQQPRDPDTRNELNLMQETPAEPGPNTDRHNTSQQMQGHQDPVMQPAQPELGNPLSGLPPHWRNLKFPSGLSIKGCNLFLEEVDFPWGNLGFATTRIIEKARNTPAAAAAAARVGAGAQRRKTGDLGVDVGAPGSENLPSK